MPFTIRHATTADAETLAQLIAGLNFSYLQELTTAQILAQITQQLPTMLNSDRYSLYVAESKQHHLLGYCAVHWMPLFLLLGEEGYISELFIAEPARGQGIGTRLLKHILAEAKQRGAKRLTLRNFHKRESYQRSFYAKHGWSERNDVANFFYSLDDK